MAVAWMTGLSGAGKSTIANHVEALLGAENVAVIDGDMLRQGLCCDLGYDKAGRAENVRRAAWLAKILSNHKVNVIATFMSPNVTDRAIAKLIIGDGFKEVYVKASIATCISRDPKGLYTKFAAGQISNMVGLDLDYDEPKLPDLIVDTELVSPQNAAVQIVHLLSPAFYKGAGI